IAAIDASVAMGGDLSGMAGTLRFVGTEPDAKMRVLRIRHQYQCWVWAKSQVPRGAGRLMVRLLRYARQDRRGMADAVIRGRHLGRRQGGRRRHLDAPSKHPPQRGVRPRRGRPPPPPPRPPPPPPALPPPPP